MKELQQYDGNQVVSWDKCDWRPREVAAPAKVLKLSEAMRIGAKMLPYQGTQWEACSPCALYTAAVGAGYRGFPEDGACSDWVQRRWPFLVPPHPLGEGVERNLLIAVEAKNGFGGLVEMPREQIADWLESHGF